MENAPAFSFIGLSTRVEIYAPPGHRHKIPATYRGGGHRPPRYFLFFGGIPVLDYIISLLSGQHMNGVDYGAIGGFVFYRLLQGSIRRIMYKVEKIVVIYIAIFLAYKLYQFLG